MEFNDLFRRGSILLRLSGDTKEGIIAEMVDLMVADGQLPQREPALSAVLERERKLSTGMQNGVAIPHGKIDGIDALATAFALKPAGVDFASLDRKPSRIFVMTVSSTLRTGPHLQYLADISKLLSSSLIRERLLKAESRQEVIDIMTA